MYLNRAICHRLKEREYLVLKIAVNVGILPADIRDNKYVTKYLCGVLPINERSRQIWEELGFGVNCVDLFPIQLPRDAALSSEVTEVHYMPTY